MAVTVTLTDEQAAWVRQAAGRTELDYVRFVAKLIEDARTRGMGGLSSDAE